MCHCNTSLFIHVYKCSLPRLSMFEEMGMIKWMDLKMLSPVLGFNCRLCRLKSFFILWHFAAWVITEEAWSNDDIHVLLNGTKMEELPYSHYTYKPSHMYPSKSPFSCVNFYVTNKL